jgi:IS5 family transposase
MVDASIVEVPRQRNSREENAQIKAGQTPETWKQQPNKLRQKDRDARWLKKNQTNFYGYKNHIKVDKDTKLINNWMVTPACDHDSQSLEPLIEQADAGQPLYGDSAYVGQEAIINECEMIKKGTKGKPLTDEQKASNRQKSKSRARVEHIFGFMTNSMKAMYVRTIGYVRAVAKIGLTNLTYNFMRCVQLNKKVYNVFIWG